MGLLAKSDARPAATAQVARQLRASEHHLAKVMQRLTRAGLVRSTRGPHGGFRLARPALQISLLEIYEAIEGPVGPTHCLIDSAACERSPCVLGGLVRSVQEQVRRRFAQTTLQDLAASTRLGEGKGE